MICVFPRTVQGKEDHQLISSCNCDTRKYRRKNGHAVTQQTLQAYAHIHCTNDSLTDNRSRMI